MNIPSVKDHPTLKDILGKWSGTIYGENGEKYHFQLELYQKSDTQDGYSIEGRSITAKLDEPTNSTIMKVRGKLSDGSFFFKELDRDIGSSWCAKAGTLELLSSESLSGRWYGSETDYNCGSGKLIITKIQN